MFPGSASLKRLPACILCFIAFLILPGKGDAQIQYDIDMERTGTMEEHKKVAELIRMAGEITNINSDSALHLLQQARNLGLAINDSVHVAGAWLSTALIYINNGKHVQARAILDRTKQYSTGQTQSTSLYLQWYKATGNYYTTTGAHDSAFICLMYGLDYSRKKNFRYGEYSFNLDIAINWRSDRQYEKALHYLKQAEAIAIRSNDNDELATVYINYTLVYNDLNDRSRVLAYTNKLLSLPEININKRVKRQAYVFRAIHAQYTHAYEAAVQYALGALQLCDSNDINSLLDVYGILGLSYYHLGNLQKAALYSERAMDIMDKDEGLGYPNAALFWQIAGIYQALGNYPEAFFALHHYARISDSLHKSARDNEVDKLETRYRIAEKDQQLLIQQAKVRNRNVWIAITSAAVCITMLIALLIYRNARKQKHILKQQKEIDRLKAMTAGEENERSRMARELHDGVGGLLSVAVMNLDTIAGMYPALPEDPAFAKMGGLIYEISNEVRNIAHNLSPDILHFHELPEAVEIFCSNIEEGRELNIEVVATGDFKDLRSDLALTSYRIIQELMQNIIKHAEATDVLIQLQKSRSLLSITVEDNGGGYDENDRSPGIGMHNIHSRAKGHHCNISINSIPGRGTSVYIEFDLEKEATNPIV